MAERRGGMVLECADCQSSECNFECHQHKCPQCGVTYRCEGEPYAYACQSTYLSCFKHR